VTGFEKDELALATNVDVRVSKKQTFKRPHEEPLRRGEPRAS